jgi:hypothetical protein
LEEIACNNRTRYVQQQLREHLKARIKDLTAQLVQHDKNKNGRIWFDAFTDVIHNLDIPTDLVNTKQLELLYKDLGGTQESGISNELILSEVGKAVG